MNLTSYLIESQESETLLINEASRLKESSGNTIYKFGFGQSPFLPPQYVIDRLAELSKHKEYVNVQGIEPLREAVATFHNHYDQLNVSAENVVVGPGSKMLIYCVLAAFKQADVMLVTPSWVSYEPQVKLSRLNTIRIQTRYEDRWRLTPEQVEQACENRANKDIPLILILNYPGNPDGLSYTNDELEKLSNIFRKHNVLVISDEIYGLLNHSGDHVSIARYYPEGTIITSGLSKWCGAGGWRLGVALLPQNISDNLKKTIVGIASETYSCAPTPVQYAAIKAYTPSEEMDDYLSHQRRILACVAHYMFEELVKVDVKLHTPEGGFYLNPDFSKHADALSKRGIATSEALCERLLKEADVAILPGTAFGYDKHQLIARIAFVDFDGVKALEASRKTAGDQPLTLSFLEQYCPKIIKGTQQIVSWLK